MFQCLKLIDAYVPKYHWGTLPVMFICSYVRENEAAQSLL